MPPTPRSTARPPCWQHAVVVGGGYAGLLAARVLADHFRRVTIVEQDTIDADTDHHSGVPQSRHPHAMLAYGAEIVEELFPGLRAELAEAGAPVIDFGESAVVLLPGGWAPRARIGIPVQTFTRPALEASLRRRVMAIPQVELRDGFPVASLCWDRRVRRVTGVSGRPRTSPAGTSAETITADLVIDATGRSSSLTARLNAIGFPSPRQRVVQAQACYTSRLYHAPRDLPDWSGTIEYTYAPHLRHGGFLISVEGNRRLIALVGAAGQSAPTDEAGFLAYARALRNPLFAETIDGAEPAGPIYRMMRLDNRWTLWHRMRPWPDRLLCIGDVLCSLNPIYGQGMTVAAIQALLLRQELRHRTSLSGLAGRYQRRAARSLWLPWLMATSTDLNWNPAQAPLTARFANWYFARILQVATNDCDVYRRFFLAGHMLKSPTVLLHPRILARVATTRARLAAEPAPGNDNA